MEKANLTLYVGGIRSGKSEIAEQNALHKGLPVLFVATAEPKPEDFGMMERIRRHRARRPSQWPTLECPLHPAVHIAEKLDHSDQNTPINTGTVLLDCVPMWMSNVLFSLPTQEDAAIFDAAVRREITDLLDFIDQVGGNWIIVSGESGLGGIASNPLARVYIDGLGLANQILASRAQQAYLVVSGKVLLLQNSDLKKTLEKS